MPTTTTTNETTTTTQFKGAAATAPSTEDDGAPSAYCTVLQELLDALKAGVLEAEQWFDVRDERDHAQIPVLVEIIAVSFGIISAKIYSNLLKFVELV